MFPEVPNPVTPFEVPAHKWSYGKSFKLSAKQLMRAVINIL